MQFLIFILLIAGMFMTVSGVLKLPPQRTSQRLRSVSGKETMTEMLKRHLLLPVIKIAAPFIRIDDL